MIASGHAFNLDELLLNLDRKKIKFNCKKCKEIIGYNDRDVLIKRIFMDGLNIILDDIIDNNITFELPTGSARKTYLRMKKYDGKEFTRLRKLGKFTNVDFLASNFSGYQLGLDMFYKDGRPYKHKPVYVDQAKAQKIVENTNNGKQYY